jgi:hypothetical protein
MVHSLYLFAKSSISQFILMPRPRGRLMLLTGLKGLFVGLFVGLQKFVDMALVGVLIQGTLIYMWQELKCI